MYPLSQFTSINGMFAEAAASLRGQGLPVQLELIGPSYSPALKRLQKTMAELDAEKPEEIAAAIENGI
jgi:hypothetical protein